MTNMPTLAETLSVRPEQLTDLTPVEIDRYNAVLWAEFSRLSDAIDKASDGLYRALLLSKKSVRRGRGYSQVWPISLPEAERMAAEHLETGCEPDQTTKLQSGLTRDGAYAAQLRKAVDRLAALRAEWKGLEDGPEAVLNGEFERRGGWSRMYLCLSDGGHIHKGRQCPSIRPSTELAWLPEVSGMEWREAFKALPPNLAAGSPAIMCTKCYPDAPVEWTVKAADPKECPGSRQYAKLMDQRMTNRVHRWAECHVCGKKGVAVTPNGNLRKHDRPEGGEESKPEPPAPEAPAAPAPQDDNRLLVIERTPLQTPPAAEEPPAPAEETPKGDPGGVPTVTAVVKFLSAAGFQHSRYVDNADRVSSGARVQEDRSGVVRVTWREGFEDYVRRMHALGIQDVTDMPRHPEETAFLQAYAEALAPRYRVEVSHGAVYVHRREELPVRPPKVPRAVTVRKALAAAGITGKISAPYSVVDQPDHTRVAVIDDANLDAVREALAAEGWAFTEGENWQHFYIKITGATPDQAARRRKLRQERAKRAAAKPDTEPQAAEEETEKQRAPLGAYVAWAEGPQERTEHGYMVGARDGDALVLGLDGEFRQMPANIPEEEPEPAPYAYDSKGRRWQQGQRAVFKSRDLFLYSGEIAGFGKRDGEPTATVLVDTRQAAPASRPVKGMPNAPGKARPISPPEEWVLPLTELKPARPA